MTAAPAAPSAAVGLSARMARRLGAGVGQAIPLLTVLAVILVIWYLAAAGLNLSGTLAKAERTDQNLGAAETVAATMSQDRPMLPAPHQVVGELWSSVFRVSPTSPRSLLYHAWVTLASTLAGFVIGTALGILLAVGMVHYRVMEMSVMPWAIASQTVPILALAPMVIVVLNSIGITGLLPKAFISAYLSFFPVVVGMASGLRSPETMHLDLLRTYNASPSETFWKLRLPASMPYLFTSLKVGAAASLVGAIVGELPTGAIAGLGARLLAGSYYGQTVQIWAALIGAAVLAAVLVGTIGLAQRLVLRRMGMAR